MYVWRPLLTVSCGEVSRTHVLDYFLIMAINVFTARPKIVKPNLSFTRLNTFVLNLEKCVFKLLPTITEIALPDDSWQTKRQSCLKTIYPTLGEHIWSLFHLSF